MFSESIFIFCEQQSVVKDYCSTDKMVCVEQNHSQKTADPYEINVFTRQVVVPITNALVYVGASKFSSQGQYQLIYAHSLTNPSDSMFQNGISTIYDTNTVVGRTFQKINLPKEYQNKGPLNNAEINMLRQNGARLQSYSGNALIATQAIRLSANIYALSKKDLDEIFEETPIEGSIILSDTASTASNVLDSALYNAGLFKIAIGDDVGAINFLKLGHGVNIASNAVQIITGGFRVYSEVERYLEKNEFNQSTAIYGFIDVGGGFAGITYSSYLLKQSKNTTGIIAQNNALLGVIKISSGVQIGLRVFGVAGAGFGFATNAYMFYDSFNNESLSLKQIRKQKVSSILGITGSSLMIASALMVTAVSGPVLAGVFVVGMGFLVAQTIYDYWF